jgi:hypothetical protein
MTMVSQMRREAKNISNGQAERRTKLVLELDLRVSLLDLLRESLHLTGTKKGMPIRSKRSFCWRGGGWVFG